MNKKVTSYQLKRACFTLIETPGFVCHSYISSMRVKSLSRSQYIYITPVWIGIATVAMGGEYSGYYTLIHCLHPYTLYQARQ